MTISIHLSHQVKYLKPTMSPLGMIAGVQVTMNTFFTTISMSLVLYASTPTNFIYLVWMSMVVETVIFVLYSYFSYSYTFRRAGQQHLEQNTCLNKFCFCHLYYIVDGFYFIIYTIFCPSSTETGNISKILAVLHHATFYPCVSHRHS